MFPMTDLGSTREGPPTSSDRPEEKKSRTEPGAEGVADADPRTGRVGTRTPRPRLRGIGGQHNTEWSDRSAFTQFLTEQRSFMESMVSRLETLETRQPVVVVDRSETQDPFGVHRGQGRGVSSSGDGGATEPPVVQPLSLSLPPGLAPMDVGESNGQGNVAAPTPADASGADGGLGDLIKAVSGNLTKGTRERSLKK